MAAEPPHVLLIDCPPSRHDGGGGRQRRAWRNNLACLIDIAWRVAAVVLVVGSLITGVTFLAIYLDRQFPSKDPVCLVAITGVIGLDLLSPPPPPPTLSPVFNLTFQIDNTRNAYHKACIPGLSRADVSYADAFLAGGSVPPFCAGEKRNSGPVTARAWGENVAVPPFLRDQLAAALAAGDAWVDVMVTMPSPKQCRDGWCGPGSALSCKPKIGDGTYGTCRLDFL